MARSGESICRPVLNQSSNNCDLSSGAKHALAVSKMLRHDRFAATASCSARHKCLRRTAACWSQISRLLHGSGQPGPSAPEDKCGAIPGASGAPLPWGGFVWTVRAPLGHPAVWFSYRACPCACKGSSVLVVERFCGLSKSIRSKFSSRAGGEGWRGWVNRGMARAPWGVPDLQCVRPTGNRRDAPPTGSGHRTARGAPAWAHAHSPPRRRGAGSWAGCPHTPTRR